MGAFAPMPAKWGAYAIAVQVEALRYSLKIKR